MPDENRYVSQVSLDNIIYLVKDNEAREALVALQNIFENSFDIDCGTATEDIE